MKHISTTKMVEDYLNNRKINLKLYSYSIIENIIKKHFLNYFKNKDLSKLLPSDINDYYISIANLNLKAKTKNNILSTVMVMINWLDIMEYINSSICRKFKQIIKPFPLIEAPKSDYLTKEEIKYLISNIKIRNKKDELEKLMIELLAYSGIRKSELRGLSYLDIDVEASTIRICKQLQTITINGKTEEVALNYTKSNKNRRVYVPKWLVNDIMDYKNKYNICDDSLIFNFKVVRINRILNRHLKNCNLKHIKIHDLRHSYCTMLYENGANSKFVQIQMGHSSERISRDIYEHLTNKMQENGRNIIESL